MTSDLERAVRKDQYAAALQAARGMTRADLEQEYARLRVAVERGDQEGTALASPIARNHYIRGMTVGNALRERSVLRANAKNAQAHVKAGTRESMYAKEHHDWIEAANKTLAAKCAAGRRCSMRSLIAGVKTSTATKANAKTLRRFLEPRLSNQGVGADEG